MKKMFALMLAAIALSLLMAGCTTLLDGSYYSVEPNLADPDASGKDNSVASNYIELRDALVDMVESGMPSGVITIMKFDPLTVETYMEMAIGYVRTQNAVGAYALDQVSYDIGTNAGSQAVAVDLTYTHTRSEIIRIKQVKKMEDALSLIKSNLNGYSSGVVLKVENYEPMDLVQILEDYAEENPQLVMEQPQISVLVYPEVGIQRVIEVSFTYQNSREVLRSMYDKVRPIFTAAKIYVQETEEPRERYRRLYSFLMESFESYTVQTSNTPTYSLLMYGVGDSKAFASTYAAMCAQSNMECLVISGTRGGEPWYWNVVHYEDSYHHVDLLRCAESGAFQEITQEQLGEYVWDYSAYETGDAPVVEE